MVEKLCRVWHPLHDLNPLGNKILVGGSGAGDSSNHHHRVHMAVDLDLLNHYHLLLLPLIKQAAVQVDLQRVGK